MPNILSHHGIEGMKWGVRRYQNEDGSLTEAGRQRYGVRSYRDLSNRYGTASRGAGAASSLFYNASALNRKAFAKKNARAKAEAENAIDVSKMSDKELRAAIDRMNLEQEYKSLKTSDIAVGKNNVADVLDSAGHIMAIGASAATIAWAIYSIQSGG